MSTLSRVQYISRNFFLKSFPYRNFTSKIKVAMASEDSRKSSRKGTPLKTVIKLLVDKWSEGYLKEAKEGDPEAMYLVGQMCLVPGGWGKVGENSSGGMRWLERSKKLGNQQAVELLDKIATQSKKSSTKPTPMPKKRIKTFSYLLYHRFKNKNFTYFYFFFYFYYFFFYFYYSPKFTSCYSNKSEFQAN